MSFRKMIAGLPWHTNCSQKTTLDHKSIAFQTSCDRKAADHLTFFRFGVWRKIAIHRWWRPTHLYGLQIRFCNRKKQTWVKLCQDSLTVWNSQVKQNAFLVFLLECVNQKCAIPRSPFLFPSRHPKRNTLDIQQGWSTVSNVELNSFDSTGKCENLLWLQCF